MKALNRINCSDALHCTERIIQFGEGNFLRAFADWMIARMNRVAGFGSSIVVVKPRPGNSMETLNRQDGLFYVNLRGLVNGTPYDHTELVDSISRGINPYTEYDDYLALAENPDMRFVISNTTEAGIAFDPTCQWNDKPASSYPGKLVQLLYHRYCHFHGDPSKGLVILPCELIADNGSILRDCVLKYIDFWGLDAGFSDWIDKHCTICTTLVDRIVPGFPKDHAEAIKHSIGFDDALLVSGEPYHLWVIEAPCEVATEFPAGKAGLNVKFVDDEKPFHQMKVALLNAPHTLMAPVALLAGIKTVREAVEDASIGSFIKRVMEHELKTTVALGREEVDRFASDVLMRFRNPYIRHELESIMLNAFSKYTARVLPALKAGIASTGAVPQGLALGLAALMVAYRGVDEKGGPIRLSDNEKNINLTSELWGKAGPRQTVETLLSRSDIWGEDLAQIPGLEECVVSMVESILTDGIVATILKYESNTYKPA